MGNGAGFITSYYFIRNNTDDNVNGKMPFLTH